MRLGPRFQPHLDINFKWPQNCLRILIRIPIWKVDSLVCFYSKSNKKTINNQIISKKMKIIYFCLFFTASVATALASSFSIRVWQTWIAPHFWNSSITSRPPLATRLLNKSSNAARTPISTPPRWTLNDHRILMTKMCFVSLYLKTSCIFKYSGQIRHQNPARMLFK